jgi:sec-independent protein translocase protein TatA
VLADLSIWHILILVAVVTLMFGAKRIPEIGASIGKGIQAFKRGLQDTGSAIEEPPPPPPAAPAPPASQSRSMPSGGAPKRLSE